MRFRFQTCYTAVERRRVSRSQPARSVLTLERWARLGKRFATGWSGWRSNPPRNSFRFCRAKLVIGWPFCSARSAPCSLIQNGRLNRLDLTPILNSPLLFGIHRELYRCQRLAVFTLITLEFRLVPLPL